MKRVVILFDPENWKTSKPPKDSVFKGCYEYLYPLAAKNGIEFHRASSAWYDTKARKFKHAWTFDGKRWKRTRDVKPDLIFDKMPFVPENEAQLMEIAKSFPVVNNPLLSRVASDKMITQMLFGEFMPQGFYVFNQQTLLEAMKKIKSSKVVLKPLSMSGAKGIRIMPKAEAKKIRVNSELIAQEFIETKDGIRGITNDRHDLRLTLVNDRLIYAYTRTPAKGSLFANISKGAKMTIVPLSKLPKSIKPILKRVESVLSELGPRIYTVDIMFGPRQKPYLVELNARPGFSPIPKKWQDKFYMSIIELFNNCIK